MNYAVEPSEAVGMSARRLERLGEGVEHRVPGDGEPVTETVDGLVMVGLRLMRGLARRADGERSRLEADVVVRVLEAARIAAMVLVADEIGDVLTQRSALGDVDHLHPAADAEQRHVALDRPARERKPGRCGLAKPLPEPQACNAQRDPEDADHDA